MTPEDIRQIILATLDLYREDMVTAITRDVLGRVQETVNTAITDVVHGSSRSLIEQAVQSYITVDVSIKGVDKVSPQPLPSTTS